MAEEITVDMIVQAISKGFDEIAANMEKTGKASEEAAGGMSDLEKAAAGTRSTISGLDKDITVMGQNLGSAADMMKGLGLSIPTSPMEVFGVVVKATIGYLKDSIEQTVAYTESMRVMSAATGASVEQLSRLVQAADDQGVSAEKMQTALQFASKNGVSPTIEGIAQLSDQLLAIQNPEERAAEAASKLGRGWSDTAPFILMGGDAIREATAAIEDGMVVTDEAVRQTEEYRKAWDNLGDKATALGYKVGNGLIPTLTHLIDVADRVTDSGSGLKSWFQGVSEAMINLYVPSYGQLKGALNDVGVGIANVTTAEQAEIPIETNLAQIALERSKGLNELGERYGYVEKMAREYKIAVADLASSIGGQLGPEIEKHNAKQADLASQIDEVARKMEDLRSKGYTPQSGAMQDLLGQQGDLQAAYAEEAAAHEARTQKILYDLAAQKLAQSNLTAEQKLQIGQQLAEQYGQVDTATQDFNAAAQQLFDTVAASPEKVGGLTAALSYLKSAAADGKVSVDELAWALSVLNGQTFTTTLEVITKGGVPSYASGVVYTEAGESTSGNYGGSTGGTGTYTTGSGGGQGQTFSGSIGSPGGGGGDVYIVQNFYGPTDAAAAGQAAYNGGVLATQRQKGAR